MADINSQGLTAQQMGATAQANAERDVIQKSVNNPGELQTGFQTGKTTSNTGGLAPVDTNFQAYTSKPSTPVISPTSNPNVLTATDAVSYTNSVKDNLNASAASQAQSNAAMLKAQGVDTNTPEGYAKLEAMNPYGDPIISMKNALESEKKRLAEEQKSSDERLAEQQRGESLTKTAANVKQGTAGTEMGNQAMISLNQEQERSRADYALQKKKILDEAWRQIGQNSIAQTERKQKELLQLDQQQQQSEDDYAKKQKSMLELQKADSQEGGAVYSMVQSGYEPDKETLDALDSIRGYNPGTSRTLYEAEKSIFSRTQAKEDRAAYKDNISIEKDLADLEDRPLERQGRLLDIQKKLQDSKTAAYDEMSKIFGVMEKLPEGMQVNIGDATYFGIDGGAIFEKSQNGDGRLAYQDANGGIQVQNIGNFGKPEDVETVYVNGMQVMRNKKTKQLMPVNVGTNAQPGAQVWAEKYPDGTTNPFRAATDPSRGECGAYCNDLYAGGKVWGNTLQEKLDSAKQYEVQKEDVSVGDSIVMSTNAQWGHVAIISQVFEGEDGKTMIQLNESNYVPPGGGKISNSRTMSIDDPRLKAIARIPLNPERAPSSPADSLNNVGDRQSEYREPAPLQNPFITPNVAMTEAQQATADQKWEQTQSLAADLVDGANEKELFAGVPADVRDQAKRIAKEQEYNNFAEEYKATYAGPFRAEDVKKEFEAYKTATKNEGQEDPKTIAQNIFSGNSNLNIADIPSAQRIGIDTELAKLKKQAKEDGDTLGYLRASAGGKDVSEQFLTSFEKAANVVSQIASIQDTIQHGGKDESGKDVAEATGPIVGILRSKNPYDAKAQELKAQLTALVPNLARGVYGEVGVLTDQDVALYAKTLPNLTSTEAVNKAILSSTIRSVARSLERKLRTSADGGRDVSGYIPQYTELMGQANQLLAESDPKKYRVVDGSLYQKSGAARGAAWELVK